MRVELPRRPESAAEARRAIESLDGRVGATLIEELKLVATELVTNSYRHAGGETIAVELTVGDAAVRVAVVDSGPGFDAEVQEPGFDGESGRGLFILDVLADRWGVENGDATRVWAELDLARRGG